MTPLDASVRLGEAGLEQCAETLGNSSGSGASAAESGASDAENGPNPADHEPTDPELAAVVAAWPTLPEAVRVGILAIVMACNDA